MLRRIWSSWVFHKSIKGNIKVSMTVFHCSWHKSFTKLSHVSWKHLWQLHLKASSNRFGWKNVSWMKVKVTYEKWGTQTLPLNSCVHKCMNCGSFAHFSHANPRNCCKHNGILKKSANLQFIHLWILNNCRLGLRHPTFCLCIQLF